MTEALIISNVALWLVVVVLAGVVLALMRQIGVLHERVAPAGALMPGAGLPVGEPAPVLQVADWSGPVRTVGGPDADGRSTLLLFVSPTCPVCKTMLGIAFSVQRSERAWLRLVLASDGPRTEHERFVRTHGLDAYPYLLSNQLGLLYQVGKLPYAALIDAEGILRARGIVNTREHLESLFEAGERGVANVQEYVRRQRTRSEVA